MTFKHLLAYSVGVFIVMLTTSSVLFAQNNTTNQATKSATNSGSENEIVRSEKDATVSANIKERIEKVLGENVQLDRNTKAIIGRVTRINVEFLAIETVTGEAQTAVMQEGQVTVVNLSTNRSAQLTDVEIGAAVTVLGYSQDNAFEAKRILISPASIIPPPRAVVMGIIETVSASSLTILPQPGQNPEPVEIPLSAKTVYRDDEGTIRRTDLSEGDVVIAVVPNPENATSSASLVRSTLQTALTPPSASSNPTNE